MKSLIIAFTCVVSFSLAVQVLEDDFVIKGVESILPDIGY